MTTLDGRTGGLPATRLTSLDSPLVATEVLNDRGSSMGDDVVSATTISSQAADEHAAPRGSVFGAPGHAGNTLVEHQAYLGRGSNGIFAVSPAAVHFAGFVVGREYRRKIRLTNVSPRPARAHVLQPDKRDIFTARYEKKGSTVPGMSLEVEVVFRPTEETHYNDVIRVHSTGEGIAVPIHAYPVLFTAKEIEEIFPKTIDLGTCGAGDTMIHTMALRNRTGVAFDFDLRVVLPHSAFSLAPSAGTVLPYDQIDVEIFFSPVDFCVAELRFEVMVGQYGFAPRVVAVVGDCKPGIVRERILSTLESQNGRPDTAVIANNDTRLGAVAAHGLELRTYDRTATLVRTGGGAGPTDPYHEVHRKAMLASRSAKATRKRMQKRAGRAAGVGGSGEDIGEGRVVDGIYIPPITGGHGEVSTILGQKRGKRKLHDIKAAIAEKRKLTSMIHQEEMMEQDLVSLTGTNRQVKEIIFQRRVQARSDEDRAVELGNARRVGVSPMSAAAQQDVLKARDWAGKQRAAAKLADDVARKETVLSDERVKHVVDATSRRGGRPSSAAAVAGEAGADDGDGETVFDEYRNDIWGMRKRIRDRFVAAVNTVIFRNRAQGRLEKIRRLLDAAGWNKYRLAEMVSDVALQTQVYNADRETAIRFHLSDRTLHLSAFPSFREEQFRFTEPVAVTTTRNIVDYDFFSLDVPRYADQMGYAPMALSPVPTFRAARTRALKTCAVEEDHWKGALPVAGLDTHLLAGVEVRTPRDDIPAPVDDRATAAAAGAAASVPESDAALAPVDSTVAAAGVSPKWAAAPSLGQASLPPTLLAAVPARGLEVFNPIELHTTDPGLAVTEASLAYAFRAEQTELPPPVAAANMMPDAAFAARLQTLVATDRLGVNQAPPHYASGYALSDLVAPLPRPLASAADIDLFEDDDDDDGDGGDGDSDAGLGDVPDLASLAADFGMDGVWDTAVSADPIRVVALRLATAELADRVAVAKAQHAFLSDAADLVQETPLAFELGPDVPMPRALTAEEKRARKAASASTVLGRSTPRSRRPGSRGDGGGEGSGGGGGGGGGVSGQDSSVADAAARSGTRDRRDSRAKSPTKKDHGRASSRSQRNRRDSRASSRAASRNTNSSNDTPPGSPAGVARLRTGNGKPGSPLARRGLQRKRSNTTVTRPRL